MRRLALLAIAPVLALAAEGTAYAYWQAHGSGTGSAAVKSIDAAAYFTGHGLENVRSLRGGIDAWSCEVDPNIPRYDLE